MRLTDQEIKQRFVRLQNLERLYPIARKRIEKLEKENRELRLIVKQQGEIIQAQAAIIEKFKLRIEDLEIKIFGKKKNKKKDSGNNDSQKSQDPRTAIASRFRARTKSPRRKNIRLPIVPIAILR
jgi:hypothetical protein